MQLMRDFGVYPAAHSAFLLNLGLETLALRMQRYCENGLAAARLPFTNHENKKGIIDGADLLKALKESYDQVDNATMPEKSDEIFLTMEIFTGTASILHDILKDYRDSVKYWRRFVPLDGLSLNDLTEMPEA
jgi:O-acetylhomoserine/O-acetylserine sulfhydrylase-like pyridoxal-dependent enzyme